MGIIWAENLILEIQIWQEELSAYIKDQNRPEYIWLYIFNRIMWPHMTRNTWSTIIWSTLMSVVRLETINVEWNSSLVYVPFLNSILVWTIIKVTLRRGTMPRGPRYDGAIRILITFVHRMLLQSVPLWFLFIIIIYSRIP